MSVELIGLFSHRADGQGVASSEAAFDTQFMKDLTRSYEDAGYDRMLIATTASWADSIGIANYLAGVTRTLQFLIAHRPGVVAPTLAARMLATVDQLSGGRVAVHIISGANDIEMQSDGDFVPKEHRYRRSAEYAGILRSIWTSAEPFDHAGEFYRFNRGYSRVRTVQKPSIPIFWGGASGDALEMAAKAADVYAFGIEPLDRTRALIASLKEQTDRYQRQVKLCVSSKIIVGETEEEAWKMAAEIREKTIAAQAGPSVKDPDLGANARRLELMQMEEVQDRCLWLGLNKVYGGKGHSVSLVGSGEQVAEALLDYYDLGVRCFLFHGYDTANDPRRYGAAMIPALREGIRKREAVVA